jgi:SagB-type dehydrogenase family enzyme
MRIRWRKTVLAIVMCALSLAPGVAVPEQPHTVALPAARRDGGVTLERALSERRSVREFRAAALSLAEVSQLLWAAQGVTARGGYRTAPSAGALYPLELYAVAARVEQLAPGVYRYDPAGHRLALVGGEDRGVELARAAYGQTWISTAPVILVLAGVERRTTRKYGRRGERYVLLEAGHAAQNALLQAVALGLGATVVGAFDDERVRESLGLETGERPLYLIPVGRPR